MDTIVDLVRKDPVRFEALECVYQLELPQCYIAAGFVRNLVWDFLHRNVKPTPLNDIDVIFFDADCVDSDYEKSLELKLSEQMPDYLLLKFSHENMEFTVQFQLDLADKNSLCLTPN